MRNLILILLVLPMFCFGQYNRKKYKEKGEVSNGLVLTIGGASFVAMGIGVRPLYYVEPSRKKPFLKQHHKAPPIIIGAAITITGLITMIAER